MRSSWWKILGVALIFYGLFAGMLVPLKPNISHSTPITAPAGETVTLEVTGYNTSFETAGSNRAWLKLSDEHILAAENFRTTGENTAAIEFQLPLHLPVGTDAAPATLIVSNPVDGSFVRPSALSIRQTARDTVLGHTAWSAATLSGLDETPGITFPYRDILGETIRNTYFHVSLWLAMMIIFIAAVVESIRYLKSGKRKHDRSALSLTSVGFLFGILGLVTGMVWAQFTWGKFWSFDVKQNMTAVALLIYAAYFILRGSFEDEEKRARISASYNIFAFVALIPLLYVVPRLSASLHPGSGGNPAFGGEDLDNTMRMIFYPIIIGWTLFGVWMATIYYRYLALRERVLDDYWTEPSLIDGRELKR